MPTALRRARSRRTAWCAALITLAALAAGPESLRAQADTSRAGRDSTHQIEAVIVTAIRGDAEAPVSRTTLDRATIEQRHFGQEVPLLLQGAAPSLTAYAETGSNWGYSYLRLRGLDQSRINLTLDGIPLNDPEDQVLYFADFPDLFSSIQSVQVQRGVGTSSTGTAAFAGSINFETMPVANTTRGMEAELQYGAFNARRAMLAMRSGLLSNRLAASLRLSAQSTDGYRYHSGVRGISGLLNVAWVGDHDIVKLMATAGHMKDTLSYLAVPLSQLTIDRRTNPLQPNELDSFGEQLVALTYTRAASASTSVSSTAYRLSASGNYDVAIAPELWNFGLAFVTYGLTSALHYERPGLRADLGLNGSTYARDHEAAIRPHLDDLLYRNTGHKQEVSAFAKLSYERSRVTWFGDLQLRHPRFSYTPDAHAGISARSIDWTFVNPRAGATVLASPGVHLFASYGITTREPTRTDMLAGADNLDIANASSIGALSRVKPERVGDLEVGLSIERTRWQLKGNVYSMDFRHEIAPIGALSVTGSPLRRNVASSYRRGVELEGTLRPWPHLVLAANATLSRNRIATYADSSGELPRTYRNVAPLLSPSFLTSHRIAYTGWSRLELSAEGRYQSRAFLTNTGNQALQLPAMYVVDGAATVHLGRWAVIVRGQNLGDSQRFSSGYAWGDEPAYFVLAPRSVFVTVRVGT